MNQTNLGGRNYQIRTGANNINYIGETHIHHHSSSLSDNNAEGKRRRSIDCSLSSFVGCINWIYKNSQGLGIRKLDDYQRKQLEVALHRASSENFDFKDVELKALELVVHYNFYYLEKRYSSKFGRMTKKEYYSRLRDIVSSRQTIRGGNVQLSSLINEREMSKLVSKLEIHGS